MGIRDIVQKHAPLIRAGDYENLETAVQHEPYDLSDSNTLVELQQALAEVGPQGLLECNLAFLEAYLTRQSDRQHAYIGVQNATRIAMAKGVLPPQSKLSMVGCGFA